MSTSGEEGSGSEGELDAAELAELLHTACIAGDAESVRELLPYMDASSAALANRQGATPLHSAAFNGHLAVCKALIDGKCDIDVAEERGCTALFLAAQSGHESVVARLMVAGGNAMRTCALGSTPQMAAIQNGWPGVVRVLARSTELGSEEEKQARRNACSGDLAQLDVTDLPPDFVNQARRMALPIRRLIVCGTPPSEVTAAAVVHALRLPLSQFRSAVHCVRASSGACGHSLLQRQQRCLDGAACARLRAAVDASAATNADSVDGLPDHQLDFRSLAELEGLIGAESIQTLQRIPEAFYAAARVTAADGKAPHVEETQPSYQRLVVSQIFVRRYAPSQRPWFGFHRDTGPLTVNIALADDACHRGGRLLGIMDGAVHEIERQEGEATIHPSTLLHGVSRMLPGGTSDARYSLICFYREREGREEEEVQVVQ